MQRRVVLLALTLGLLVAITPRAKAFVVYTVDNPAAHFTLFTYDSPGFITTHTTVPVAGLTFANPLNAITSVEFLPSSLTHPGTSEVDVFQSSGGADQTFTGNQFRYYPQGTFTQYGVTPGLAGSFGVPNSQLVVAAPEPSAIGLVGAGLLGLAALRRRASVPTSG
jgi:PEP-CTERM motif